MKKSSILALSLSAFMFFGCAAKNQIDTKEVIMKIKNQEYKISKIIDKSANKTYQNAKSWGIIFDDSRFGMFVGCNRIFGQVEKTNTKIVYKNPASTRMMCPADMMEIEDLVLKNLTEMNITKDGLENDEVKIVFDMQ